MQSVAWTILLGVVLTLGGEPGLCCSSTSRRMLQQSSSSVTPRINNGQGAAPGQFPYHVTLYQKNEFGPLKHRRQHYCGGTLIAPNVVLTTASCTYNCEAVPVKPYFVRVGATDANDATAPQRKVKKVWRHRRYDPLGDNEYNIALLELDQPVDGVPLAKLATPDVALVADQALTVMGMGLGNPRNLDNYGVASDQLLYTTQVYVSPRACQNYWSSNWVYVTSRMMCAGSWDGNSACEGDEGNPIITPDGVQVGIVSLYTWFTCGVAGAPSLNVRVSAMYDWISKILKQINGPAASLSSASVVASPVLSRDKTAMAPRISYGQPAKRGQFPYMTTLHDRTGAFICGGSLVAPNVVLTAAHCVFNCRGNPSGINYVRAGVLRFTDAHAAQRSVKGVYYHPQFDNYNYKGLWPYDVALLKLNESVADVPLTKLPGPDVVLPAGQQLTVMGFGMTEYGDLSDRLMYTSIKAIEFATCKANQALDGFELNSDTQFCAGSWGPFDSCPGDSGSPVLNGDGVQVGLVSWGSACGDPGMYGGYSNLITLQAWVKDTLAQIGA